MKTASLIEPNLTEFFRDLLQGAMRSQHVESSQETEFYLVKLLEGFASADHGCFDRPLALEYLEAFHSPVAHRYGKWKRVGDTSLFLAGLFMESLHRRMVSSDYYAELGRTAYKQLAHLPHRAGPIPVDLFAELADRFGDFVRVFAEISFRDLFRGDVHTLRLYTRWLYTRSEQDAQRLRRQGIIPYVPPQRSTH